MSMENNHFPFSELLLGFSQHSYSANEGLYVVPRVVVKGGHLGPSISIEVLFGTNDGTAIG